MVNGNIGLNGAPFNNFTISNYNIQHLLPDILQKTEPDEEPIMEGEMTEINEIERRDNMLENILLILNSAAAIGVGPQMNEFGVGQTVIRKKSASKIPGTEGGIKRGYFFLIFCMFLILRLEFLL